MIGVFKLDQTAKDTLINVFGTGLVGLIGLIFYIVVARNLGPEQFGLFSVASAILVLTADLFDLGVNTGIVKFVAEFAGRKKFDKASKIAKFAFIFKLLLGFLILVVGILVAKPLSQGVFKQPLLTNILPLVFFGALIILLLGFFTSLLQAFKKFFKAILLNLSANILRLLLVIILTVYARITVHTAMLVFAVSPIIGVAVGFLLSPIRFLKSPIDKKLTFQFFGFNKWVAVGFILAAIQVRLPNFFLVRLSNLSETGLFGAASTLTLFAPQVATALSITFAPLFSQMKGEKEFKQFFKKTLIITLIFSLLTLILIPLAKIAISLTVGSQFINAIPSFQILVLGAALLILSVPNFTAIVYYWSKPQIYAQISILQLIMVFILNLLLIPQFGAIGASISLLVSATLIFALSSFYILFKWQNQ